jgi:Na+-transporting NADH:ubiquinone oxidoreductase subunit NqrE
MNDEVRTMNAKRAAVATLLGGWLWFIVRRDVHASEGGAAAATAEAAVSTPVGALMAGHVLRDGELVLLILRPSRWFILLSSLKFLAIVTIFAIFGVLFEDALHIPRRRAIEAGVWLGIGRIMWGVLQWMGRLYVLTDMRIIRLSGVFNVSVFDCALRKVARTMLESNLMEKIVRIGSIVIIPQDEEAPIFQWHMVARPRLVHKQILSAIHRAKQGNVGCHR